MACNDSQTLSGIQLDQEGASSLVIRFTRTDSDDNLLSASARIKFIAGLITLELTSTSELVSKTNTAKEREFEFILSEANKTTLLNGNDTVTVEYKAFITPSGGAELLGDRDSDAIGEFTIIASSSSGGGNPVPAIETIDLAQGATGDFPENRSLNHLVNFINPASAGTAVGDTNPVTMLVPQVWYPASSPSANNSSNWRRLAIDPRETQIVVGAKTQAAIEEAITAAFNDPQFDENVTIIIPSGTYTLSGSSVLTAPSYGGASGRKWVSVIGDGSSTTLEIEPNGGAESWLYNNGNNKDWLYSAFKDFLIIGTDRNLSNGIKLNPSVSAPAQGFNFWNIHFENLAIGYETTGSIQASETTFVGGRFRDCGKCIVLNNLQSVNHRAYGTDFELVDTVLEVGAGGGGNVNIRDGSLIPINGGKVFDITRSSNLGSNNCTFTFSGVRAELRGDSSIGTISGVNETGNAQVIIENSKFTDPAGNTSRNILEVDALSTVIFKDTVLPSANFQFEIQPTTNSGLTWHGGRIELQRCLVSQSITNNIAIPSTGIYSAHVRLRDCIPIAGNPVGNRRDHYALDADFGALTSGNGGNLGLEIKRAQIFNPTSGWPTNTGFGEHVLHLPPGALIVKFFIWRPAGTNTASPYSLVISSDDKVTTYLETNTATGNTAHTAEVEYSLNNAITVPDNKLRIYCNGAPGAVLSRGGTAYIEYF